MRFSKCLASICTALLIVACGQDSTNIPQESTCDFSSMTSNTTDSYGFDSNFSEYFTQSSRWESENADITVDNGNGLLTAQSDDTSVALEAWKLFKTPVPYNKSWEISLEVNLPLYWNSNGGTEAQVGAGIFVGKPVASGQSSKVYECNFAAINGGQRFVQAQLIANRLGDDPIDVQHSVLEQATESVVLSIQFCNSDKTLSLLADGTRVGTSKAIDSSGLDDWKLTDSDMMDIGIMGFAENTVITDHPPTIDDFNLKIY